MVCVAPHQQTRVWNRILHIASRQAAPHQAGGKGDRRRTGAERLREEGPGDELQTKTYQRFVRLLSSTRKMSWPSLSPSLLFSLSPLLPLSPENVLGRGRRSDSCSASTAQNCNVVRCFARLNSAVRHQPFRSQEEAAGCRHQYAPDMRHCCEVRDVNVGGG